MTLEPGLHPGGLVGRHVVEHDVELALRVRPLHPAHEGEEVGARVAGAGFLGDRAGRDLECREQAGRAVADVVVGPPLDRAPTQWQHGRGPVERLDLGLLVDREHDRPLGRIEVQADHVPDLGLELRIGAELERLDPVRLETRLGPDPLDRRDRHADPARDPAGAPVGRPVGRWLQGQGDHPVPVRPGVGRRPSGPWRVAQAGQAFGLEAPAPQQHRHEGHAELRRDPLVRDAIGCADHDPRPLHEPLLARPGADQAVEDRSLSRADHQLGRGRMGHAMKRMRSSQWSSHFRAGTLGRASGPPMAPVAVAACGPQSGTNPTVASTSRFTSPISPMGATGRTRNRVIGGPSFTLT